MKTIVTRLGLRLFRKDELRQAFHRIADPDIELRSAWERIAWAFMRCAHATGLLSHLYSEYLRSSDVEPSRNVYDEQYLNLRLNRVYDLPDVVVDPSRHKTVNVLVPAFNFNSLSAGFFGVFHIAQFVRRIGYNVRLVLFDNFYFDHEEFRTRFQDYPGMESLLDDLELAYIGERRAPLLVSHDDTCIATVWYSAWFAKKIAETTGNPAPFLYLIQDYETRFFPNSSLSVLAEQSYHFNYFALFSTQSLRDYFTRHDIGGIHSAGKQSEYFNNACSSRLLEKSTFISLNRTKKKRKIVFYSRPVVDRNMFELAALTLIRAFDEGIFNHDEWECVGMGLGEAVITFCDGTTTMALPRMTLREYQDSVVEFDICLTLMASPHPSLVPMDLAGSGAMVVTNMFETKTRQYLEGLSGNIIPAQPDVPALLEALRIARDRCDDLDARHDNASTMAYPREWSQSFDSRHRDFIAALWSNRACTCELIMDSRDGGELAIENAFSAKARVARPVIRIEKASGRRTLIVVGNGRGGTSMVAGVLVGLGVPMGALDNSLNYEDPEIVEAGRHEPVRPDGEPASRDGLDPLRPLIEERNARNEVWGWKDPSADLYLERIKHILISPRAIFVHRDLASVAESIFVRSPDISIEQALELALERTIRYWEFLTRNGWPTLLLSYERARMAPDRLVAELTAFCGLEPTESQIERTISFVSRTGGYRLLGS